MHRFMGSIGHWSLVDRHPIPVESIPGDCPSRVKYPVAGAMPCAERKYLPSRQQARKLTGCSTQSRSARVRPFATAARMQTCAGDFLVGSPTLPHINKARTVRPLAPVLVAFTAPLLTRRLRSGPGAKWTTTCGDIFCLLSDVLVTPLALASSCTGDRGLANPTCLVCVSYGYAYIVRRTSPIGPSLWRTGTSSGRAAWSVLVRCPLLAKPPVFPRGQFVRPAAAEQGSARS